MSSNALHPEVYRKFSASPTAPHWAKVGFQSRAGVCTPLFSLYSRQSTGIGELPDLRLLVDWCRTCGLTIIQLLPLNDVGFNFTPYDAQSMFALDPMYLSFGELAEADPAEFRSRMEDLRRRFPAGRERVDYGVKQAKLDLFRKIFNSRDWQNSPAFSGFRRSNVFWLPDFALFKVLKNENQQRHWEEWEDAYRRRDEKTLRDFRETHAADIQFQEWLQWQLYEQFCTVKTYARKHGVLLMGDLPFLVSRDSADVWSNQGYFKLDAAAGAPPDAYQARGQRWGMPPYDWDAIARHQYDYLVNKLRYAEHFYDFYRIDHFVGIFRLWTIPLSEPAENAGLAGAFDPRDESQWENHGRMLLEVMLRSTTLLPCAEDLGVVPPCSFKVLDDYSIVGMDVQRWYRDWDRTNDFKRPEEYRPNSIAVISTHDMSGFRAWWEYEAGSIDEWVFREKCPSRDLNPDALIPRLFDPQRSKHGRLSWKREIASEDILLSVLERRYDEVRDLIDLYRSSYPERAKFWEYLGLEGPWQDSFTPQFALRVLEQSNRARSIFSIQLLQDWLAFSNRFDSFDPWSFRINFPGTISDRNWSLVMPFSLEELLALPENRTIKALNEKTERVPE